MPRKSTVFRIRSECLMEDLALLAWKVEDIVSKEWVDIDEFWDKRNKKNLPPGWKIDKWLVPPSYTHQATLDYVSKNVVILVKTKRASSGIRMIKIYSDGFDILSKAFSFRGWSSATFTAEAIAWRASHYTDNYSNLTWPETITPGGLVPIRVVMAEEE